MCTFTVLLQLLLGLKVCVGLSTCSCVSSHYIEIWECDNTEFINVPHISPHISTDVEEASETLGFQWDVMQHCVKCQLCFFFFYMFADSRAQSPVASTFTPTSAWSFSASQTWTLRQHMEWTWRMNCAPSHMDPPNPNFHHTSDCPTTSFPLLELWLIL